MIILPSSGHYWSMPPDVMLLAPLHAATPRVHAMTFEELFAEYSAFVWRSLRRLGLQPADADDACQEVFITVHRKHALIEVGRERAYLFGVCVRVAAGVRRSRRRKPWHTPSNAVVDESEGKRRSTSDALMPDAEQALVQAQQQQQLDAIVAQLPDELRPVFVSYELLEMTMQEIALALQLPPGTVASRLRRARELFTAAAQAASRREQL